MTTLYSKEIAQACVDCLKDASLSFSPKVVQRGDLVFLPEVAISSTYLPAIFVRMISMGIELGEENISHQGDLVRVVVVLRIVAVQEFEEISQVWDLRSDTAEEIAEAIIAAYPDLDAVITGFDFFAARPTSLELIPDEDDIVALGSDRRLFAVAVDVEVIGRASR